MIDIGGLMSERLMKAYEKKEEARIKAIVDEINADHLNRMKRAGEKFKLAHPEPFAKVV